jgi:hypothetical protein
METNYSEIPNGVSHRKLIRPGSGCKGGDSRIGSQWHLIGYAGKDGYKTAFARQLCKDFCKNDDLLPPLRANC